MQAKTGAAATCATLSQALAAIRGYTARLKHQILVSGGRSLPNFSRQAAASCSSR
jgi:hypothetical protein